MAVSGLASREFIRGQTYIGFIGEGDFQGGGWEISSPVLGAGPGIGGFLCSDIGKFFHQEVSFYPRIP